MLIDAHVHVVGQPADFPLIADRPYLPGVAPLAKLLSSAARRGIERFVIVQPSFYGTDNSLLLQCLDELGVRARGVAMVENDCSFATLSALHQRSVRGLRVNLYTVPHNGALPPFIDTFHAMVDMAGAMKWHVEIIAPMAQIAAQAELIASAGVNIVLDHYGLHEGVMPNDSEGQRTLNLMRLPHIWMKLSAPYRSYADENAITPDQAWLAAFLEVAADRCVWGSDWPWTPDQKHHFGPDIAAAYRAISYEGMVDRFREAICDAALARRLMQDNSARLYEFVD